MVRCLSVEDDAQTGVTVQHFSRIATGRYQPNLRQVHLIIAELHHELNRAAFQLRSGDMGESVLTGGLDLLVLP